MWAMRFLLEEEEEELGNSSSSEEVPEEEAHPREHCGEGTFWNDHLQKCIALDQQHMQLRQMADHASYSAKSSNQRKDHVRAAVAHMDVAHALHQAGFHDEAQAHHSAANRHQKKLNKHQGCELDSHWNALQGKCMPLDPRHQELLDIAEKSTRAAKKSGEPDDHEQAHQTHREVADALYQAGFKHLAHHHRVLSRKHATAAQDSENDTIDNPAGLPSEEQDTVASQ
jgi:hypothetical protein